MYKEEVRVVIPIYKTALSDYECISLRQVRKVLGKHSIVIIKPKSLDISSLWSICPQTDVEEFDDKFFQGISAYNRLMLSPEFYSRFADSRYILIYQLDAYVFKDDLIYWCRQDYDYIGAPWLVRPIYRFPLLRFTSWLKKVICSMFDIPNSQVTNFKVGNGGFSLRKVSSHLRATTELHNVIEQYLAHRKNHIFNEDVFFSIEVNKHGMNFRYPSYEEALKFSFDKYPKLCFQLTNGELPFGCHSWYKRHMKKFWFPVILSHS